MAIVSYNLLYLIRRSDSVPACTTRLPQDVDFLAVLDFQIPGFRPDSGLLRVQLWITEICTHEGHIKNKDVRDNFKARKQSLYYRGIGNNLTIKFIAILARFYRNITGYILHNPYAVLAWMFFHAKGADS